MIHAYVMGESEIDCIDAETIHFSIVTISKVIKAKQVKNCIKEFLVMEDLSQHAVPLPGPTSCRIAESMWLQHASGLAVSSTMFRIVFKASPSPS